MALGEFDRAAEHALRVLDLRVPLTAAGLGINPGDCTELPRRILEKGTSERTA